jgi:hypothetical protein
MPAQITSANARIGARSTFPRRNGSQVTGRKRFCAVAEMNFQKGAFPK